MIISFNFLSFLMLTFFIASGVSEAHASPSRVSLDCKLKIFEEKKWQSVDSSLFSNQSVDTYESARQPDRLYFKFENKIYTGLKSCFIDVSPTENAGAAEKTALDSTSEALKPEHRENWTMFFGLGSTLSPKTSHAVTIAGITGNSNESGSAAVAFNFEALYHFSNYFGLSAIIESNKYIYQGGASGSGDSELALLFMPRAEWVAFSNFSIWLGAGGGLMLSTIQGGGYSSNGLSFAGQTQTPIGFDFSPRVGASFKISDKSILDFNLGYTTFGGSFTGTYSSSTTSGTFSDNFKRNWTNFFVRWGINL